MSNEIDAQLSYIDILVEIIKRAIDMGASDIHLSPGIPPQIRVDGEIMPLEGPALLPSVCKDLIYSVLTDEQKARFERERKLDISFGNKAFEGTRIRMNVYYLDTPDEPNRKGLGAAIRILPAQIPLLDKVWFPDVNPLMKTIANLPAGLVLVTGPTGSGKSTTLASIINHINEIKSVHILTIEEPIEFLYQHNRAIIHQREAGVHTDSFARALKYVLRQDPDVIMVGEMRDFETISMALTAAETGHLVLSTLHTSDAIQSINRIIDVFPPHQQPQVRAQLSFVIKVVFSQILVPSASGKGRVLACEIMLANTAICNLIRTGRMEQARTMIQGGAREGMQTMNMSLARLCMGGRITREDALKYSPDTRELIGYLGGKVG